MSGDGRSRGALLSCGAVAGLVALAWCDSFYLSLVLGSILGIAWLSDWAQGPMYTGSARLDGKVAIVTGANRGIGYETTKGLVSRGARVYMACRDVTRGEEAKKAIEKETGVSGQLTVMPLDLASLASVHKFAEAFSLQENKLHILVNNAGFAFHSARKLTEDGQEQVFQVNHLGSFLLTNLLVHKLRNAGGQARVISLSSVMHKYDKKGIQFHDLKWEKTKFDSWKAYGQSKLATIYFMRRLGQMLQGQGVTTYSVHPGVVGTDIGAVYMEKIPAFLRPLTDLSKYFMKSSEHGAQTTLFCAIEPSLENSTGKYYADCAECEPSSLAKDDAIAQQLWDVSMECVGPIHAIPVRSDCPPMMPPPIIPRIYHNEPVHEVAATAPEMPLLPSGGSEVETLEFVAEETLEPLAEEVKPEAENLPSAKSEAVHVEEILMAEALAPTTEADKPVVKRSGAVFVEEILTEEAHLQAAEVADPVKPAPRDLLEDIKSFTEASLTPVKVSKPVSGEDLMKHELMVKSVETFDKSELNRVKTTEPLSGVEVVKQELIIKSVTSQMETFDRRELRHTEVVERNRLPDADTLREERGKADLLSGIQSFQTDGLSSVATKEPLSGLELMTQEIVVKSVKNFDRSELKVTTMVEKQWIPSSETILEEKSKVEHLSGIAAFPAEELKKVKTKEPLSGLELLKQELTQKAVVSGGESFPREQPKHTEAVEKVVLPDMEVSKEEKVRTDFLRDVEEGVVLSPVLTKEPLSGVELVKQELLHQELLVNVAAFGSTGGAALRPTTTQERAVLPDMEALQQEKSHNEFMKGISSFDPSSLKAVRTVEPLSGSELAVQEIVRKEIGDQLITFDRSALTETIATEKVVLPGVQEIQEERRHLNLLHELEDGVSLKKVDTKEPPSPIDLARLELGKSEVEEEILQFDRSRLTPVATEEKIFLPTTEQVKEEKAALLLPAAKEEVGGAKEESGGAKEEAGGAKGLKILLLEKEVEDKEERARRSSSEEWERVSTGDLDKAASDC